MVGTRSTRANSLGEVCPARTVIANTTGALVYTRRRFRRCPASGCGPGAPPAFSVTWSRGYCALALRRWPLEHGARTPFPAHVGSQSRDEAGAISWTFRSRGDVPGALALPVR